MPRGARRYVTVARSRLIKSLARMGVFLLFASAIPLSMGRAEPAAAEGPAAESHRPRIGLALSGGGARGLAEVGVLRALEDEGIPIDCIAGTSMGAVVGGFYACGVPVDSLAQIAERPELFEPPTSYRNLPVFQKRLLRPRAFGLYFSGWEYRFPRALVNDFNINLTLVEHTTPASLLAGGSFDALPIPFRTLAMDLHTGEIVVFDHGDLALAIRSSMAVPLAFPPIPLRNPNRILIDPGSRDNLPVGIVREMGCDRVIAVNCASREAERKIRDDAGGVALDLVRILSQRVDSLSISGWDVWIEPRLGGMRMADFDRREMAFQAGYQAARSQMDRIRSLIPAEQTQARTHPCAIRALERQLGPMRVAWVRLEGRPSSYAWVPRQELKLNPGDPFSMKALGAGLRRLYATNHYESIWPSLALVDSGSVGITLDLEERAPTYVSVGALYDNSRMANVDFEILRDNVLRLGETFHASLMLGNFYDGVEAGVRSSHLRGVPLGMDLLLRSDRSRYGQSHADRFVRRRRLMELRTSVSVGQDGLLLAGAGLRRDEGEHAVGVADWSHLDRVFFACILVDRTDEREFPSRGIRLHLRDEIHLAPMRSRLVQSFSGSCSWSMQAGRFTLTPGADTQGLSRPGLPFWLWHRSDLSRATLGRYEPDLYAPYAGGLSLTTGLRLASNLHLWGTGTAGTHGDSWRQFREARANRGLDAGLLQRTPVGPVLAGVSVEEGRRAFVFIQVGHDLWTEP
jgi:NTE family protein